LKGVIRAQCHRQLSICATQMDDDATFDAGLGEDVRGVIGMEPRAGRESQGGEEETLYGGEMPR